MNNVVMQFACLAIGMAFRWSRRAPENASAPSRCRVSGTPRSGQASGERHPMAASAKGSLPAAAAYFRSRSYGRQSISMPLKNPLLGHGQPVSAKERQVEIERRPGLHVVAARSDYDRRRAVINVRPVTVIVVTVILPPPVPSVLPPSVMAVLPPAIMAVLLPAIMAVFVGPRRTGKRTAQDAGRKHNAHGQTRGCDPICHYSSPYPIRACLPRWPSSRKT